MASVPTIQSVFAEHFGSLCAEGRLSAPQYRAGRAIVACRSQAMGGHEQRCPKGHFVRRQYHSCRHRSCPTCSGQAKAEWLDKIQQRLLPCDHFHVIFTVPHELLPLWRYNRREFTAALFAACRDTLMQLLEQDRHLGATPGVLMALHTWGRTLNPHPHIHCLVTAGGLTKQDQWRAITGDYLLPAAVVKAVYRGKLLERLTDADRQGRLACPRDEASVPSLLRAAARKRWNVRLESRYGHGRGVAKYLARYVRGGPITNTRIASTTDGHIRFRYRDHRDGKNKIRTLTAHRFMAHLLWHVPEPGQHTVRHVGLYAHAVKTRREQCRLLLDSSAQTPSPGQVMNWQDYLAAIGHESATCCPTCGRRLMRSGDIPARRRQNSHRQGNTGYRGGGFVQRNVGGGRYGGSDQRSPSTKGAADFFWTSTRPLN